MVELALPKNSQITEGKVWPNRSVRRTCANTGLSLESRTTAKNRGSIPYYIDIDDCGPMVLDGLLYIKNNMIRR